MTSAVVKFCSDALDADKTTIFVKVSCHEGLKIHRKLLNCSDRLRTVLVLFGSCKLSWRPKFGYHGGAAPPSWLYLPVTMPFGVFALKRVASNDYTWCVPWVYEHPNTVC